MTAADGSRGVSRLADVTREALGEISRLPMGAAAAALSSLLSRRVHITGPDVTGTMLDEVRNLLPMPVIVISVRSSAGVDGDSALLMAEDDARRIVEAMPGSPGLPSVLGRAELNAIGDAAGRVMGEASTALSEVLGLTIDLQAPVVERIGGIDERPGLKAVTGMDDDVALLAFGLRVDGLGEAKLLQLVPLGMASRLAEHAAGRTSSQDRPPPPVGGRSQTVAAGQPGRTCSGAAGSVLGRMGGVAVRVRVVMGKARLTLAELQSLDAGDLIALDRRAGDSVQLLADDHPIGWGEIITVDGRYGVRIRELSVPPLEATGQPHDGDEASPGHGLP